LKPSAQQSRTSRALNNDFKEALKHITGEELHLKERARPQMERFIAASPANDRKFLEDWYNKEGNLDPTVANIYRFSFNQWKREDKSRSAKKSRSMRGKVKRKDDKRLGARLPG
jgi:hypothetical protein